jgi:hypothetical protein
LIASSISRSAGNSVYLGSVSLLKCFCPGINLSSPSSLEAKNCACSNGQYGSSSECMKRNFCECSFIFSKSKGFSNKPPRVLQPKSSLKEPTRMLSFMVTSSGSSCSRPSASTDPDERPTITVSLSNTQSPFLKMYSLYLFILGLSDPGRSGDQIFHPFSSSFCLSQGSQFDCELPLVPCSRRDFSYS